MNINIVMLQRYCSRTLRPLLAGNQAQGHDATSPTYPHRNVILQLGSMFKIPSQRHQQFPTGSLKLAVAEFSHY